MRLRLGIPFTIALALLASAASALVGFNVYYLLVGVCALWVGLDSRRIRIQEYATQLALPALPLVLGAALFWPFFFPWYLRVRGRIKRGELPLGKVQQRLTFAIVVLIGIVVLTAVGLLAVRKQKLDPRLQDLYAVAQGVAAQLKLTNNFSLSDDGAVLTITLPLREVPEARRDSVALAVARYALTHYARRAQLRTIRVGYVDRRQIGIVTYTNADTPREWSVAELAAAVRPDTGVVVALPEIATVLTERTLSGRWRLRACERLPAGDTVPVTVRLSPADSAGRIAFDTTGVFILSGGAAAGMDVPVLERYSIAPETLTVAGAADTTIATDVHVSPRFLVLTTSLPTRQFRCRHQTPGEGARFLFERSQ